MARSKVTKEPLALAPAVLTRDDAAKYAGMATSTMERECTQGRFPKPRKLTAGRVGWLRSEIDAWAQGLPVSDLLPGPGRNA